MTETSDNSPNQGIADPVDPHPSGASTGTRTTADQELPPDELPPVQPPSAGFIFQLFVIPALIVAAIIGVYTLFGRLASGEQDWRKLVAELRNTNEHRRWRAALGLAQMLRGDHELPVEQRKLANNPQVGKSLVDLYEELRTNAPQNTEKDVKHRTFLCTTLGMLDQPEMVLPPLQKTMLDQNEALEVRNAAITAIAQLTGRLMQFQPDRLRPAKPEIAGISGNQKLIDDCIVLSGDEQVTLRKLAAFTLGLFSDPQAQHRLEVLLQDNDANVQTNAAIGLARQNSTAGGQVFRQLLQQPLAEESESAGENAARQLSIKNSLKAVGMLAEEWTAAERAEFVELIRPISQSHPEPRIRTDALAALQQLSR